MVSDALRFTGRVAGELGRMAWSSVSAGNPGIPRSIEAISLAWIDEALTERFPGASVADMETLGGDSGTTERRRIGLVYAPGARPAGAPDSIFVKFRPPGLTERLFGNILALGPNEVGFYRDIAGDVPVRAPECYCARDGSGEFVLVLEDLASKGAQFRTIADPISLDEAKAWEHYRSFSLYAYLGTSVTTSMSDLQPRHIAELGLKRAATAVDDLGALALLEAL